MKILFISHGLPSHKYPLNGIFAFDQARALVLAGLDVCFFSIDLRGLHHWRHWGVTSGKRDGVRWYTYNIPIGPFPRIVSIVEPFALNRLYKKVFQMEKKPDVIHSHFTESMAAAQAREVHLPLIITEHSSVINQPNVSYQIIQRKKAAYVQAAKVIAVSQSLSKMIKKHTGIESIVIPNIIDIGIFETCKHVNHKDFRLVTTSNLIPLKRTADILKALYLTGDHEIFLDIVGDGSERNSLEKLVYNYGLSKQICFHGLVPRDKIPTIYEKCDCFIMVSQSETFGVSYAEAIAAGLPVIATRCGGPEDFVDETNGIMVEVGDVEKIKEAILTMKRSHLNYDKEQMKKSIISKFSPQTIAKKLMEVYESVKLS